MWVAQHTKFTCTVPYCNIKSLLSKHAIILRQLHVDYFERFHLTQTVLEIFKYVWGGTLQIVMFKGLTSLHFSSIKCLSGKLITRGLSRLVERKSE